MRHDSDFAAYTAARWPAVVRTLVLLGGPQGTAEQVARAALARCHHQWGGVRDHDDPDVAVYRTVLDAWSRRRWAEEPHGVVLEPALEVRLDRLTPEHRRLLALRHGALLSDEQVARVLEHVHPAADDATTDVPAGEELREAVDAVDVPAPPVEAVLAEARGLRRRRRLRTVAAVGGLAAVVALATWLGTRPDAASTDLGAARVTLAENPADVGWWANNTLHLEHVSVELPPVTDLTEVTGGAVYGDEQGRVILVADDGDRDVLGRAEPGAPVVVSDAQGWAVWAEPRGDSAELVVYDLSGRVVLGRVPGGADLRPVAIDQDRVFYVSSAGAFGWAAPDGVPEREPFGLLDVSSAVRVRQAEADRVEIVQSFFSISFVRTGVGAELSPDGNHVLTRAPDPESAYGTVHIYDTRSGAEISTGLTPADLAVAARLGKDRTVTYVVARAEDKPEADDFVRLSFSGPLELRTCSFDTGECVVDARFPSTGTMPVLAR